MRKKITLLAFLCAFIASFAQAVKPVSASDVGQRWSLLAGRSDEFNGATGPSSNNGVDTSKWNIDPRDVGTWTWDDNNVRVEGGELIISTTFDQHTRRFADGCSGPGVFIDNEQLHFRSGVLRSNSEGVFGYYEAEIKGHASPAGFASPSFWLQSTFSQFSGEPLNTVLYNEIDIVELQQGLAPATQVCPTLLFNSSPEDNLASEHNLHANVVSDVDQCGRPLTPSPRALFKRPANFPDELENLHHFEPSEDPSQNYHVYGMENRPDAVIWYIDGQEIARKENRYHGNTAKPMQVTMSMGLRRRFSFFECNQFYPKDPMPDADLNALPANEQRRFFPESLLSQFPLEANYRYIRTYEAIPSLWVDAADIATATSTEYTNTGNIELMVNYHPGSGHSVESEIQINLIHKDASNGNVTVYNGVAETPTVDTYGGKVKFTFNLSQGVTPAIPTADLAAGEQYIITGLFKSSKVPANNIFITNRLEGINIVGDSGLSIGDRFIDKNKVSVFPNPISSGNLNITFDENQEDIKATIYSVKGKLLLSQTKKSVKSMTIPVKTLSKGIYFIAIKTGNTETVKKFIIE